MNRPFIHGINFEERLRTKLEALGCRIYYDQTYDHQYKLDFIVSDFPRPLGCSHLVKNLWLGKLSTSTKKKGMGLLPVRAVPIMFSSISGMKLLRMCWCK